MRNLCLVIVAVFFINGAYAQSSCIDTNITYLYRATALYNYEADTGYVIGTNYITEAIGDYFTVGQAKLTGVLIWFASKAIEGAKDSFNVYVFNVSATDTLPTGAAIDSAKIAGSDIDTAFNNDPINWTYVRFPHEPLVSNYYAIVVQTYYGAGVNVGDTISIFGDAQGDAGNDPGAIMLAGNANWYNLQNVWTVGGQPDDVDAMMSPIVDESFNAAATVEQTATCPGSLIDLNVSAFSCSGIASFIWSGPGINNPYDESTTATVPSNQTNSATYSIMVIDSANDTLIKSVTIPVNNLSITAGNDTTIPCYATIDLDASVSGHTGAGTTIQWQNGPSSLVYPNVGPGTYTVTIVNATGCSASATVQVLSAANNTISFSTESSGCTDSTVYFTNTSTYTSGWSWDWNFGDGVGSSLTNSSHAYLESGEYSVSLTGDSGGCRLNSATVELTISNCNGGSSGNCNALDTFNTPGVYPASSLIPCIADGQAYSTTLVFKNYTSITDMGNTIEVDSLTIDSINNLPCGITWSTSVANNTFDAGELGCIKLSGSTNDPAGQYTLDVHFTLYIAGITSGFPYVYSQTGNPNIYVRVIGNAGDNCPAIDTNLSNDISSCSSYPTLTVSIPGPDSICNGSPVTLAAFASGGTGYYSYLWSNYETTTTITVDSQGTYSVTVTDYNGHKAYASVLVVANNNCGLVWPGDANDDGQVDYRDVLQIALINGSSGPARVNASIQWTGQVADNWDGVTNGINDKYGDCDGNGIINFNDTLAVTQNYGLTHNKTGAPKPRASDPVLTFAPESDTIVPDSLFKIMILLGTPSLPVDTLYGLGFYLAFNPAIFDTNSIVLAANESWLSNNALTYRKLLSADGQLVMVISATNQENVLGGNGLIGELTLKALPVLPYFGGNSYIIQPTALLGVTTNGTTKTFNVQPFLVNVVSGINNMQMEQDISVYPNPNSGHFQLTMNEPSKQLTIQLLNIEGMTLYTEQLKDVSSINKDYDFNTLAKGVYLLKLSNENGVVVKRLVVQ